MIAGTRTYSQWGKSAEPKLIHVAVILFHTLSPPEESEPMMKGLASRLSKLGNVLSAKIQYTTIPAATPCITAGIRDGKRAAINITAPVVPPTIKLTGCHVSG